MSDQVAEDGSPWVKPYRKAVAISPHNTTKLARTTRAIFIGTGGDITMLLEGDSDPVTFKNVPDGAMYPLRVQQVRATGTDAQDIVGLI